MPFSLPSSCRFVLPLVLLATLLLAACSRRPAPPRVLAQDVYVWQRQWTPALRAALSTSNPQVTRWHVLAAELGASGRWIDIGPDAASLAATGKPLLMTVRINGQLARFDGAAIEAHLLALLDAWRAQGLSPAALEIDYDCATARLPEYTAFLLRLKTRIAPLALAVTALPTWLDSPRLDALLASADESVLQVHAVLDPRQGLFDPVRAREWMVRYAGRTAHPWHVALPAYGSRVVWDDQGRIAAVESERALLAGGSGRELMAQPQVLARFVSALTSSPEPGLAGITWFRLPTGDDRRAWSLATWMAVLERRPPKPELAARMVASATGPLHEIRLDNTGDADAPLPLRISINARGDAGNACAADGINGYALEHDRRGSYLRLTQAGLLRAGASREIGWLRCADGILPHDTVLQIGS
ncbi:DUF3142 domain-containing protein [Herbaspirillum sp. NPDC087042]|uniref:DUF3142 domain-containing protein n=1 Tax=Herbaspirillum sp. NPDC087042 TaxID=3364004 RepID=UPI00382F7488